GPGPPRLWRLLPAGRRAGRPRRAGRRRPPYGPRPAAAALGASAPPLLSPAARRLVGSSAPQLLLAFSASPPQPQPCLPWPRFRARLPIRDQKGNLRREDRE